MQQQATKTGHRYITTGFGGKTKTRYVHRLVAEAFHRIAGEVTHHLNRNPADNRPENLQPTTYTENLAHARATDPCVGGSWAYEDERLG